MTDSSTRVLSPGVDPAAADKPTVKPKTSPRRLSRLGNIDSGMTPSAWVWAGLGVASAGLGVIFFSWIKVAGLLDVALQMPYVVSGGMTGLALVIIGMAVVDMSVRSQDRQERRRQIAQLRNVLEELRSQVDGGR